MSSHLNQLLNGSQSEKSSAVPLLSQGTAKGKKKASQKGSSDTGETSAAPKSPPLVSIAAIVGGMSAQKQRRVLDRGVDILVATPGRLWDIMEQACASLVQSSAYRG